MKNIKIAIIDYGMGNLQSVFNALKFLGVCDPIITYNKNIIEEANGFILPGVGAFGDAMNELEKRDLINILNKEIIDKNKPLLGICLGMQLLFQKSEEKGLYDGLGFLEGQVKKFQVPHKYRIPHIGWNNLDYSKNNELFNSIQ